MKGLMLVVAAAVLVQEKRYRLPSTDLKQQVIWGSTAGAPDGFELAFGGEDQKADDGNPHTRIREGGDWKAIHSELRAGNPLQGLHDRAVVAGRELKRWIAKVRTYHFEAREVGGKPDAPARLLAEMERAPVGLDGYGQRQLRLAKQEVARALEGSWLALSKAAEFLDAEPAPRALSPIAYDPKTKLFVLFGGDHLDYLTNDTWVFDPAKRRWFQRHPESAPPPRANHKLAAAGEGKITLSGGYAYTSNTDYCGGQYRDHADGEWVYDIEADAWTGAGKAAPSGLRTYRTGRLHPDHYLEGPKPDRDATSRWQAELPPNLWSPAKPPQLPALNRDWGSAVLDPDRDLILRWSGGHSAHGGTDVLQYHLATNRWELTMPVEFPLGQLYSNTEYPEGVNFNGRPWVTGHTYQSYGYDPNLKKMLFVGQREPCHIYDPDLGDWTGRLAKPKGMAYGSCFYTLTLTPTPAGLVCWTHSGTLFQFDAAKREWVERPVTGGKLPASVVDNSTVVHDTKRDRLLFWRKPYGDKTVYDGEIHAVDLKTWSVSALAPGGKQAAAAVPYLCQIRYDIGSDLFLVGGTLPPGPDGFRRTPAYDPSGNRWISLRIGGDDPSGPRGRNVSLGLMYDATRKLFWAVDTNSRVHALRLDPKSADVQPLE